MVDSSYFTDFNRELTIHEDRLLLDYRKCDYNIEMYQWGDAGAFPIRAAARLASREGAFPSRRR